MIRLENISMTFAMGTPDENTALKKCNTTIRKGDFITIIGSNGAGKSTLYNIIAGTYTPTSGKVLMNTDSSGIYRDITGDKEYKRAHYIGRIFQNPLLGTAGNMTLEDNMMICAKKGYKGLRISLNAKTRNYFKSRLEVLGMGLENRLHDNVDQFSGGQRQALTLLMAVMSNPSLLLLDEHTAALDPSNAEIVMNLTRTFAKENNLTVMMITHNMTHALSYGTRLLMMDDGEIILDIGEEEKAKLTMDDIVKRFHAIKHKDIDTDKMRLA